MRATRDTRPIASVLHVAHADTNDLGMLRVLSVRNHKVERIIKVSPNFLTLTEGHSSGQKVRDSDFALFYACGIEESYTMQRFDCCRYTTASEDVESFSTRPITVCAALCETARHSKR